jgi:hypothetical protein
VGDGGGGRGGGEVSKGKEKRNLVVGGEKIKLLKKTEIRAEKGQIKKVNLGWHRDRKEEYISAPSIHVGALVCAGSLWPICTLANLPIRGTLSVW